MAYSGTTIISSTLLFLSNTHCITFTLPHAWGNIHSVKQEDMYSYVCMYVHWFGERIIIIWDQEDN